MPLSYIMTAEENYDPTLVAGFNAGTPTAPYFCLANCANIGQGYDAVRRVLVYQCVIASGTTTTNTTGATLWDGFTAVANGGSVNTELNWNFQIGRKDIDAGTVTFYNVYNAANKVPDGIGPSATGWVDFGSTNPSNGQNIVLNGTTWTFVTSGATGNQTNIGATARATALQLALDLNASADSNISPAWYHAGAAIDLSETGRPNAVTITYKIAGTGGNAYTLGAGTTSATTSGTTLSGGAAGSDGTWQRMFWDSDVITGNTPTLINPRTGDVWLHAQSCELYAFFIGDNFEQVISPMRPVLGATNPVYPIGITTDWVMSFEGPASIDTAGPYHMYLIPTTLQTEETTLDQLLVYATFDFPDALNSAYFRWCTAEDTNVYFIAGQRSGAKDFKLWKFALPSSAPWGGPIVGGGFTDITPWGSFTGPNTNVASYTVDGGQALYQQPMVRNILYHIPTTSTLVAITKNVYQETGEVTSDYDFTKTFWDCTYVDISGSPTFDWHSAFVTGYMAADWTPTNLAGASYAVYACWEMDLYLNQTDYVYIGHDYSKRWIMFATYKVTAGVVDVAYTHCVFVQYKFAYGSAPTVLQVIDEDGWDTAYAAYGSDVGDPNVVFISSNLDGNDHYINDNGIYDTSADKFWLSGSSRFFYYFNSYYTNRMNINSGLTPPATSPSPPLLTLSFGTSPILGAAYFIERMDNREWTATEDVWAVDCGLSTELNTPNATLTASSSKGAGIPTGVTGLAGGQGYSAGTTATIDDPNGTGASVSLTIASGIITAISITGGTGYTYPVLVFNDPAGTGAGASATVTLDNSATFTASASVFSSANVGDVIRMGGGIATVTAYLDTMNVTANITVPITQTIPNTGGVPAIAASGSWSIATPISTVHGLWHLIGFDVVGLADGIPIGPLTVQSDGSVTLPNPATLITLGLKMTPQFQTLYFDGGQPTAQGRRKKLSAATVRMEASGMSGITMGVNQPDGAAQSPPVIDMPWTGLSPLPVYPPIKNQPPYGVTTIPLFTGDARAPLAGGFDKPGQLALQQNNPLPMNILAVVPEVLPGDEPQLNEPDPKRRRNGPPDS